MSSIADGRGCFPEEPSHRTNNRQLATTLQCLISHITHEATITPAANSTKQYAP